MIKKIKHTLLLVRFMGDNIQGISSIKAPLTEYMHTTYMMDTCTHYLRLTMKKYKTLTTFSGVWKCHARLARLVHIDNRPGK